MKKRKGMSSGTVYALVDGKWRDVYVARQLGEADFTCLNLWWENADAFAYNGKDITAQVKNAKDKRRKKR